MTAEIGQFCMILALLVALFQVIIPQIGAFKKDYNLILFGKYAAIVQLILILLAFLCLTHLYVTSDFSVLNVWQNSHSQKPLLYKISGVWGNHEGSLLLWVLILAIFGAAVAAFGKSLPPSLVGRVISIQAAIGFGFLILLIFLSNPFARISPTPIDGNGLNPLLQDPGLAFHPPFLYLGYVGFSIAFSFAIAALIEGKVDAAWARWVRPWTLAAWSFLTIGISLGSWWAYYELGWGGWWFWDPVENASFMPWLIGTALLHSAIVVEKRDTLKSWTILLAILTFSFSLLGTFIVRSGILNSVHSFASDPGRGVFILGFLILTIGGSLALYTWRAPSLKGGGLFSPISREASLVINNLLLMSATATVLLGTLYPLILDAISGEKVSVGPPYYLATFIPIMTPLVIVMGIGPMLAWKRADLSGVLTRLWLCIVVTVFAALITMFFTYRGPILAVLGMILSVWLITGALADFIEKIKLFKGSINDTYKRFVNYPRSAIGGTIAHAGVGVLIFGITLSSSFEVEKIQSVKTGDNVKVGDYIFKFKGTENVKGPNYNAVRGNFDVYLGEDLILNMQPENRSFKNPEMVTTEAAIYPRKLGDLYAVLGEKNPDNSFSARLYYKPMINCLWIGCLMMALGGFISLSDRKYRIGAPRKKIIERNTSEGAV